MSLLAAAGALAAQAGLVVGSCRLFAALLRDRDRPDDPLTRVRAGPDGSLTVEVDNPSPGVVLVGLGFHRVRAWSGSKGSTTVRAARPRERRRLRLNLDGFLGAVPGRRRGLWETAVPRQRNEVMVVLGLAGGRTRVHRHVLPARPAVLTRGG